jgi:hypothetical protein
MRVGQRKSHLLIRWNTGLEEKAGVYADIEVLIHKLPTKYFGEVNVQIPPYEQLFIRR